MTAMGREHVSTMFQSLVFGLAGLGGQIVALLIFATLVAVPLRDRELRSLLARPVTRTGYLTGRAAAGVVLLAVFWLLMTGALLWFFARQGDALPVTIRYAPLLLFLKCAMLGLIALALSLYVRPVVAAILTFVVSSDWVSSDGLLYVVLPGDDRLGMAGQILTGRLLGPRDVILAAAYALVISSAALCVALLRFRRMEIP
jgi:ABC-type transport system involved in multi-copper enzyme maturation permease subunit